MAIHTQQVTKAEAEQRMTALGDNWWKCLYDGKYHHLGPQVFDQGLHRRQVEPGYFESARKAFLYAKEHLCEKLTVEFYQELHRIACAHFKGKETNTSMGARDTGRFRLIGEKAFSKICIDHFLLLNEKGKEAQIESYYSDVKSRGQPKNPQEFQYFEQAVQKHLGALRKAFAEDPILKDKIMGVLFCGPTEIGITYCEIEKKAWTFEGLVKEMFDRFNEDIAKVASGEERVRLIADLFQRVEWLHPYIDGQGRTDLLLLTWLLCSHGLNPAILHEPYFSTWTTLDKWAEYLKEGMQSFRSEVNDGR